MSKPAICSLVSANGPSAASTSPARTRIVVRQSSFEQARALAQQTRWPGAARPRSCDALVRSLATSSANALIIIGCIMTSFGLVIASTSTRRMNSTKWTPSRPVAESRHEDLAPTSGRAWDPSYVLASSRRSPIRTMLPAPLMKMLRPASARRLVFSLLLVSLLLAVFATTSGPSRAAGPSPISTPLANCGKYSYAYQRWTYGRTGTGAAIFDFTTRGVRCRSARPFVLHETRTRRRHYSRFTCTWRHWSPRGDSFRCTASGQHVIEWRRLA